MLSAVAVAKPFMIRAPTRLPWVLAAASQTEVPTDRAAKMRLVKRLPKMLEHGTMIKLAYPSMMTESPVRRLSCCVSRWKVAASKGNIGATERADSTDTKVNKNCTVKARSVEG